MNHLNSLDSAPNRQCTGRKRSQRVDTLHVSGLHLTVHFFGLFMTLNSSAQIVASHGFVLLATLTEPAQDNFDYFWPRVLLF